MRLNPKADEYAGAPSDDYATIEHLRAIRDGGSNRREDIALACYACNAERA